MNLPPDITWLETPDEILRALRRPAPPPPGPTPELAYLRLRHAWRIARARATLNNWIDDAQPLEYLLTKDEANEPETYWLVLPTSPRALTYPNQMALAAEIDPTAILKPIPNTPGHLVSVPTLRAALTRQTILPQPDDRWQQATLMLAERLNFAADPVAEDPNTGNTIPSATGCAWQAAMELLDIPDSWPPPNEILDFEHELIDMAVSTMIQRGRQRAGEFFLKCFKLTRFETQELLSMARARARDMTLADVEEKRALMELNLEELAQRCKKGHDLRAELGTYKALAVVQGIARAEVEDDGELFARIVKRSPAVFNTTATVRPLAIPENTRLEPIGSLDEDQ